MREILALNITKLILECKTAIRFFSTINQDPTEPPSAPELFAGYQNLYHETFFTNPDFKAY